jgi:type IV pilus assembly protein PilM
MIFRRNSKSKSNLAVGLDFGARQLKAAVIQRSGEKFLLIEYAMSPWHFSPGNSGGEQAAAEQLQQLLNGLRATQRSVRATVSCPSAVVAHTDFPRMPAAEAKSALRLNSARYLRRDFSDYYFDATELIEPAGEKKAGKSSRMNILVAAASKSEVTWYRNVLAMARLHPQAIELAAVSVVNAFQLGEPEISANEVVLLLDIGAQFTTMNFLRQGQLLFTRIMQFGGGHVTDYVAQTLTIQPQEAEQEKLQMTEVAQTLIRSALTPLAKELRSSIDFFERQHDCRVSKALACGGSACSGKFLDLLSDEAGIRLEAWNPVRNFDTTALNGARASLESLAPSLAAAVGAAAASL